MASNAVHRDQQITSMTSFQHTHVQLVPRAVAIEMMSKSHTKGKVPTDFLLFPFTLLSVSQHQRCFDALLNAACVQRVSALCWPSQGVESQLSDRRGGVFVQPAQGHACSMLRSAAFL